MFDSTLLSGAAAAALSLMAVASVPGCGELDTSRENTGDSFGTIVVELACKRMAYLHDLGDGDDRVDVRGDEYRAACAGEEAPPADAPEDVRALLTRADVLAFALDTAVPEQDLAGLQAFLTSPEFLALYDDDEKMRAIDAAIEFLRFAADDPDRAAGFHQALVELGTRDGYLPASAVPGMMAAIGQAPEAGAALRALLGAIAPGGPAAEAWDQVMVAAGAAMRAAAPTTPEEAAAPDRTTVLARDLLFSQSALLGAGTGAEIVLRDARGLAMVQAGADGTLPAPFVDGDGDGLADVDAQGRFVDADGAPVAAPAPYEPPAGTQAVAWPNRDDAGRALAGPDGPTVYTHVALDSTLLASLGRDAGALLDPDQGAAMDALRGLGALLGPRAQVTGGYGDEEVSYRGFDAREAALLDMLHGFLQILRDPGADEVLTLADVLVRDHEPVTARLLESVMRAARTGDEFPDAALVPGSPMWDDMMPIVREIASRPGLFEDLMRALEDPAVARFALNLRNFMQYSDRFTYDDNQQVVGSFTTPVDRSRPDNGFDRSLWQRLLYLITDADSDHDRDGAPDGVGGTLCSKPGAVIRDAVLFIDLTFDNECELFEIENLSLFFLQSMVYARAQNGDFLVDGDGNPLPKAEFVFNSALVNLAGDLFLDLDEFLEDRSGIQGFRTRPTPEALTRVLFLDPTPSFLTDLTDPPICHDGEVCRDAHADTLQVWEVDGFYDNIRPLLQAFADHDAELLFLDLIRVMHNHWPSRQSLDHQQSDPDQPRYAFASNARSWEPLMVEVLSAEEVMPALVAAAPTLNALTITDRNGLDRPVPDIVRNTALWLLVPQDGLAKRDGSTETVTGDGRPVPTLSPWYLLADAYARRDAALSGPAGAAWHRGVRGVVDILARGEEVPGVGWRFQNPRLVGTAEVLIGFLRDRMAAHRSAGDLDAWLSGELVQNTQERLTGPLGAALVDFADATAAAPEAERGLARLLGYALAESQAGGSDDVGLASVADLVQMMMFDDDMVGVAHLAGEAVRPERDWVAPVLGYAYAAALSDRDDMMVRLIDNLSQEYRRGRTPLGQIARELGELHRARPNEDLGAPFASDDYPAIFRGVAQFLDDEKRGLRKFIAIIKGRNL
ncbi:hypothetical protein [Haliangium sp.]|uniref:hypothetical protein n=1 Tax=Haliangium sp. TaxID=2663208 RepID=UPI003D0BEFA1